MKRINILSILLIAAITTCGGTAYADHHSHWRHGGGFYRHYGHPRFSFYLGIPWYPRPYFSYPYYPYYPPTIVTVPANPPVYIERDAPQATQQLPSGYWYYCSNPEGYYPYVRECPSGWRQVDPIPPQ